MKKMLEKSKGCNIRISSTQKIYIIPNDINIVSDFSNTMTKELVLNQYCSGNDVLNIDLALVEMITNAIEHGNLELTGEEKSKLIALDNDVYINELYRRSKISPYKNRCVRVEASLNREMVVFSISDEGKGFDFKNAATELKGVDALRLNGRGIIMARAAVDEVKYSGNGNTVTLAKYFNGFKKNIS
jgi:anti-sigma regulatory factor (Ser/Thr protein kinase)